VNFVNLVKLINIDSLALSLAFLMPTLICGFGWNDFRGGFFYAGIIRLVFVHHATFLVNSLAHTFGAHTYSDRNTPRDSVVTALLTFGEGYHNFHHEFPNDYRTGIKFYHYDPTKWLIRFLAFFDLCHNLKEFSKNEIKKGEVQMLQKKVDRISNELSWGRDIKSLPVWTMSDITNSLNAGDKVIIIDNVVYDISRFVDHHPGGPVILTYLGTEASSVFHGDRLHHHSNAAINLLSTMRLARYVPTNLDKSLAE